MINSVLFAHALATFSQIIFRMFDSLPGGCEFDPCLRQTFFPAYFRLSPLQKHVRKVVGGFGEKSCFGTGVRKSGPMIIKKFYAQLS